MASKTIAIRLISFGLPLLLCALFAGCSTPDANSNQQQSCLVFGRVGFSEKVPKLAKVSTNKKMFLTFMDTSNSVAVRDIELKQTESLYNLRLFPGDYAMLDLTLSEDPVFTLFPTVRSISFRIYGQFTVATNTPLLYIGDLNLSSGTNGTSWCVVDAMPEASAQLKNALPAYAGVPVVKQLMKLEGKRVLPPSLSLS